jgi:hypothetical protein
MWFQHRLAVPANLAAIRITELRIRIPISASTPRIATKPRGAPLGSRAITTPIRRGAQPQTPKTAGESFAAESSGWSP